MNELTTPEVNRLEKLEMTIAKGMRSFIEVGMALSEIQSTRLYRAQYESFEDYCQTRWNFTASRGRQLVGAVEAIASLPDGLPKPTTASQAEALSRIRDEERRAEVWETAIERSARNGRTPTARDIGEIDIEIDEAFDEDDGNADWLERSKGEDEIEKVKPVFLELLRALRQAAELADQLSKTSAKEWLLTSGSALMKHIRDAKDHVHCAKPVGVCPLCKGVGCDKCFDTGWMNSTRWHSAKPRK